MLCTNGHTCPNNATYCSTCGANTFDRSTINQFGQIARPTNGLAIAALVLGIVWVYWIGSILALIFGLMARKQIRETGASGEGMAIAGIVLGIVGIVTGMGLGRDAPGFSRGEVEPQCRRLIRCAGRLCTA